MRLPRVVLVGDAKQLDAVDAGKPFHRLQQAGMWTAVMDESMRQRDPEPKEAVEASLKGDIGKAFEKLGDNVAEVNPDNLAGAAAARRLALSPSLTETPRPWSGRSARMATTDGRVVPLRRERSVSPEGPLSRRCSR